MRDERNDIEHLDDERLPRRNEPIAGIVRDDSKHNTSSLAKELLEEKQKKQSYAMRQDNQYFHDKLADGYKGAASIEQPKIRTQEVKAVPSFNEPIAIKPVASRTEDPKMEQAPITTPPVPKVETVSVTPLPKVSEPIKKPEEKIETLYRTNQAEREEDIEIIAEKKENPAPIAKESVKEEKVTLKQELPTTQKIVESIPKDTNKVEEDTIVFPVKSVKEELKKESIPESKTENPVQEKEETEQPEKKTKKAKKEKKNKKRKMRVWEIIFCSVSTLFIIACCIFYGSRLIHYYKIYNPKTSTGESIQLLSSSITRNSTIVYEEDGLYMMNGTYIYKGENVNNYLVFSNMIWRILKTNTDGSIDIVLDDPINNLSWNKELTTYTESDINHYLNNIFLTNINKDMLIKGSICTDTIDDLSEFKCNTTNEDYYVRLLNISDFLNSKTETTFIAEDEILWLSSVGTEKVWHTNGTSISSSTPERTFGVLPVVTLANSTPALGGTGTKEDPYIIEKAKESLQVGKYVQLDQDIWTIYEVNENEIRLVLSDLYKEGSFTYRFDVSETKYNPENENSIAFYLNNTFYNELTYKDLVKESIWYTGGYTSSYEDVYAEEVKAKVGMYNVADLKYDLDLEGYFLLTAAEEDKAYLYNSQEMLDSKITMSRKIRPAITIAKLNIQGGAGTKENPYKLEGAL